MHHRVVLWIRGYVSVRVSGGSLERFVNLCNYQQIPLWDLEKRENAYECFMSVSDFRKINGPALKAKVRIKIRKKIGLPFEWRKNKTRVGGAVGLLAAFFILYGSAALLWNIEYEGNRYYSDAMIRKALKHSGIHEGMRLDQIVCEEIEKMLRIRFPDMTWVSAEISGTYLKIHIKENEAPKQEETTETVCDIRAAYDGRILSIITRAGTPLVKAGDEVRAGDLLIRGMIDLQNDSKEIIGSYGLAADGDILAEYEYTYQDHFPTTVEEVYLTGKEKKGGSLEWNNQKITWGESEGEWLTLSEVNQWGNLMFRSIRFLDYASYEKKYSIEEARALAEKRLAKELQQWEEKGIQAEYSGLAFEELGGIWHVTAHIRATGPIGEKVEANLYE